jgi:hypothetical protein
VRGEEFGDRRREVAHAEVERSRQPYGAAGDHRGARRLLLGLFQVGEELHGALVKRLAALGQADAAGGAV